MPIQRTPTPGFLNRAMQFQQTELIQQIADAQARGFAIKSLQHRYLLVNDIFAQSCGMEKETIVGKNDLELGLKKSPAKILSNDSLSNDSLSNDSYSEDSFLNNEMVGNPARDTENKPESSDASSAIWLNTLNDLNEPIQYTQTALRDESNQIVALMLLSSGTHIAQPAIQDVVAPNEQHFSALNNLLAEMMAYTELDPLLQHIAETMVELTLANDALILLVDETHDFMQVVASAGTLSKKNIGQRRSRGKGFASVAWSTGKTQYIADSDTNTKTKGYWPSRTELIAVPLLDGNTVIGVIVLGKSDSQGNISSSKGLINNLAGLASIAILSTQSFEQSRSEMRRTRALSDISKRLSNVDCAENVFDYVSKTLVDAMDITHSNSYRVNSSDQIVSFASWKRSDKDILSSSTLSDELVSESIVQWCFDNNKPVHIRRNQEDERESSRIHQIRKTNNAGSTLCWPVTPDNKAIGVLTINRERTQRDFDENEINLFTSVVHQLSSALYGHEMSRALHHQVHHDSLTSLPNRRYFEFHLQQQLDKQNQDSSLGAIMFLDLDGFKAVNDNLGHSSGDELLKLVALRLINRIPDNDMLARIGGDEFAVIACNLANQQEAISIAERLAASLCMPFRVGDEHVDIGTSIGVSFFPVDGLSPNELLHNADQAMYQAKSNGKNQVVCYEKHIGQISRERSRLEIDLQDALTNHQFELHFQPQVDTNTGTVNSVEALIRWQHPERGMISPALFVPIAEESGLINHIGAWVIHQAIWQLRQWKNTPLGRLRMGINIAAAQFLNKNFSDDVLTLLSQMRVNPEQIELEVTESVVLHDMEPVVARLNHLRAAGVRIAIDDFGTGYSSLSYLQDLPLDILKIDRAFVTRLENEQANHSLVNTIMLLAKGLKLSTIAEGVETARQLELTTQLGCHIIQGYYFSKPCSAQELPGVIEKIESSFFAGTYKKAS